MSRGDVICIADTDGTEEMNFDQFMALAASGRRPLTFDIRRIQVGASSRKPLSNTVSNAKSGSTVSRSSSSQPANQKPAPKLSADAHARKQAVIAAAEARDRVHKAKTRPTPKSTSTIDSSKFLSTSERRKIEAERKERLEELKKQGPQTEASRIAVEEAKKGELKTVSELGFNLYEAKKLTGDQARNATTDMKHGFVDAGINSPPGNISSSQSSRTALPSASSKSPATSSTVSSKFDSVHESFDETFTIFLSSNKDVTKSISTMHKLIINATTKGRGEGEDSSKFRRVKLSNAKINELIVSTHGGLDLMMLFGFILHEEDGETFLIYPLDESGPSWMTKGLESMKSFIS